jgi:hypothetical protein
MLELVARSFQKVAFLLLIAKKIKLPCAEYGGHTLHPPESINETAQNGRFVMDGSYLSLKLKNILIFSIPKHL